MSETFDTVVLGAGVVGASTAAHLHRRGLNVLLIDRNDPGQETSFGNSGIIETSYVVPFGFPPPKKWLEIISGRSTAAQIHIPSVLNDLAWIVEFYRQSQPDNRLANGERLRPLISVALEEHRRLMSNSISSRYLKDTGRIQIFRTDRSFKASSLERKAADHHGVPYEILNRDEFKSLEPDIAPIIWKAVRWTTSARATDPGAVTASYADGFLKAGGQFIRDDIKRIEPTTDSACRVIGSNSAYRAKRLVVCTGPWAPELLRPLGYIFPQRVKRGYHQHYPAPENKKVDHAVVDSDVGYLLVPTEDGIRLTTGAEFAGIDARPNPKQLSRILPFARQLLPLGEALKPVPWVGNRPCFADSLPAIGRAANHEWLWLNFGHGHSGFTIGPASGRLIAEMIMGETPFCDPTPYRPSRFLQ